MKWLSVCLLFAFTTEALAAKAKAPAKRAKNDRKVEISDVDQALILFTEGRWADALERLELLLAILDPSAKPSDRERRIREYQVLSLYELKRESEAIKAFGALVDRFPEFAFDEDRVLPKTVAFFAKHDHRAQKAIVAAPDDARPLSATAPALVQPTYPQWSPAFLVPLGIGQFIAHSPVRGAAFLLLQAGFIAMNVVGFILFQGQLVPGTKTNEVVDLQKAQSAQLIMNIGFIGWISALVAGTADAVFFESVPFGVLGRANSRN